ncbi:MAG: hypothetical protein K2X39_05825 [Silvanigrellaceae bacterium]|nr:hypothetical protein [Silvanigrellaceae bacterium]
MSSSFFFQSMKVAINRSILQIASIVITAILGLYSTQVLSEFSLALSFAAMLFVLVSYIQLGVQPEFSQYYAAKNYTGLLKLLRVTMICIFIVSAILIAIIWTIPSPFSNSDPSIGRNSWGALKIIVVSLPLVGLLTSISYFLESIGVIGGVTKLMICQFFLQIFLVISAVYLQNKFFYSDLPPVFLVASSYVLSDFFMLIVGIFFLRYSLKSKSIFISKDTENTTTFYLELLKVIKFGLPVMLGALGQKLIFYFCVNFCAILGVWQTSVFTIMISMTLFLQIPLIGVASLLTLKISNFRGKKDNLMIINISSKYQGIFIAELVIISLSLFLFYRTIIGFFTYDMEIINRMLEMKFYVIMYFIMNASLIFNMSALRGFSDNFTPQLIVLSLLFLGIVPYVKFFSPQVSLTQLIIVFTISGVTASSILYIRLKKNFPASPSFLIKARNEEELQ